METLLLLFKKGLKNIREKKVIQTHPLTFPLLSSQATFHQIVLAWPVTPDDIIRFMLLSYPSGL